MNEIQTLAWVLRQARLHKQLTQAELARRSDVPRTRICQFEAGLRQPYEAELVAIAPHLDVPVTRLRRLKLEPSTATSDLLDLFAPQKPRYRMPRDRETSVRLLALRSRNRARFDTLWMALRRRADWARVRRFLVDVVADSRHEIHAWILLLQDACEPARLPPLRVGYRTLPVVVPKTHVNIGDCAIPALVDRGRRGVVLPQVTVLTPGEFRIDGLVGMRLKNELRWCAAEIDGAGHDSSGDPDRTSCLRMPVVRFSEADLERSHFAEHFWSCVRKALWPFEPD